MDITLQAWHWVVLAFALLGFEALGLGGFLIGSAVSAVAIAAVILLNPEMSWPTQVIFFGTGSLLFTYAYWRFFKKINDKTDAPELNNRALSLVGRTITLEHDIPAGLSRLQIGDTRWEVEASQEVAQGAKIVVKGAQGMRLRVEPI